MKKIFQSSLPIFILSISLLMACGNVGVDIVARPSAPSTTAVITLSTAVIGMIPSGTTINSYDVTVPLPDGVTVRSTTNPPITDYGVVTATGSASESLVVAVYTASTSTQAGAVKIHIVSVAGISAGDFCIVTCDIAAGNHPTQSSFAPPTLDVATGYDSTTSSTVSGLEQKLSLTSTVVVQ